MTLEISLLVSNSYELMGLKSLLCLHYKGDPQKICFLPANQPPSDERVSITFRDDVVTLTLPEYCGSTQSLLPRKNTATWHIPLLSRNCPLDDIAIKIKKILCLAGGADGQPTLENLQKCRSYTQLSETEYQVLVLIGQGLDRQRISRVLNRSQKTISTHYRNVSRKMGASNRAELYRYALFISRCGGGQGNTLFL